MFCKYCGYELDKPIKLCSACGKNLYKNTPIISKKVLAKIVSIISVLFTFYVLLSDNFLVDGYEWNPLCFVILFFLVGCAIALYITHIDLINIICYGAISITYFLRLITLEEILNIKLKISFISTVTSMKKIYFMYFIVLGVLSFILFRKYVYKLNQEAISNPINRRNIRCLTSDDMNKLVLSGIQTRFKRFLLIIGSVSCLVCFLLYHYIIISNNTHGAWYWRDYFTLREIRFSQIGSFLNISNHDYFILSILYVLCIGIFLSVIQRNNKQKKPIIQLRESFKFGFCAFVFQICLSILFKFDSYYSEKGKIINILLIAIYTVLSISFYVIYYGFMAKLERIQLKILLTLSIICLWISLAIDIFIIYDQDRLDQYTLFDKIGILTDSIGVFVTIILLFLLNSMKKNLKSMNVSAKDIQEKPLLY